MSFAYFLILNKKIILILFQIASLLVFDRQQTMEKRQCVMMS